MGAGDEEERTRHKVRLRPGPWWGSWYSWQTFLSEFKKTTSVVLRVLTPYKISKI